LHIRSKHNGFEWFLVPIYGAAQDAHKAEFISELVRMCEVEPLPMRPAGDFNIRKIKVITTSIILSGCLFLMLLLRICTLEKLFSLIANLHGVVEGKIRFMRN
jgi:hypothetical protein